MYYYIILTIACQVKLVYNITCVVEFHTFRGKSMSLNKIERLTQIEVEDYRAENFIGDWRAMELWAKQENRVLTILCDSYLAETKKVENGI